MRVTWNSPQERNFRSENNRDHTDSSTNKMRSNILKSPADLLSLRFSFVWFDLVSFFYGILNFMGVSLKVNVIAQLEFELAYCDVTIQHVCRYTRGTSSSQKPE